MQIESEHIEPVYSCDSTTESDEIIEVEEPVWESYILTAYCPCMKCCGKTDWITATGTQATHGRTFAVD